MDMRLLVCYITTKAVEYNLMKWPHIYVIFNLLTKAFKIPFSTSKTYVHPRNQRKSIYLASFRPYVKYNRIKVCIGVFFIHIECNLAQLSHDE